MSDDIRGRDQFFPAMTIDPVTGIIYITYYDRSETSENYTDVFVARSKDGGRNFTNIKVSRESFDPGGQFLGDYIDIAAYNGKVYPVWTNVKDGSRTILTAIIDEKAWR